MSYDWVEATLGAVSMSLRIEPTVDWGMVQRESEETENIYADENTQLRTRTSALRHMKFTARLRAATKDDLIDQENALRNEVAKYSNVLTVHPAQFSGPPVSFVVRRSPPLTAPFDRSYEQHYIAMAEVELICSPWGLSDTTHILSAAVATCPAVVEVGTVAGQGEPLLNLDITRNWGAAGDGNGMDWVAVGMINKTGLTISNFFCECEAGSGTNWTSEAQVNAHAGNYKQRAFADSSAWGGLSVPLPTGLPEGRYRVFARAKGTVEGKNWIAMQKQANTNRDPRTREEVLDHWQWYDMGEWVNYGLVSNITMYGHSDEGSVWLDCLCFIPVDWGWMWYNDPTEENTHKVHFGWLYDQGYWTTAGGATMKDATARIQYGHGLKGRLEPCSIVVLVEAKQGLVPAPSVKVDLYYEPRWEMWPG